MEKADEIFAKETLALLERSGINIVSAEKEGGKFKAVFTIIGTSVKYTIEAQKNSTSHSAVEPDPRGFGDCASVVEGAMRDWYPGKTNHWEEVKKTVAIRATGLSEIGSYQAVYEYDPTGYIYDYVRKVERILDLISDKIRDTKTAKIEEKERVSASRISKAFSRI